MSRINPKYVPGTLFLALACTLAGGAMAADKPATGLSAVLTGPEEAPKPGDADGRGGATVTIGGPAGAFCYRIKDVMDIAPATMAHIHRGARGVSGPVVVPLEAPANGGSGGCPAVSREIADEIAANPTNFYVNVHNAEHPGGAIRGQLVRDPGE